MLHLFPRGGKNGTKLTPAAKPHFLCLGAYFFHRSGSYCRYYTLPGTIPFSTSAIGCSRTVKGEFSHQISETALPNNYGRVHLTSIYGSLQFVGT